METCLFWIGWSIVAAGFAIEGIAISAMKIWTLRRRLRRNPTALQAFGFFVLLFGVVAIWIGQMVRPSG